MNRNLARLLSYLFHPVIFPIIGVFAILKLLPYYISSPVVLLTMAFVFTGTYIIPVVFSFLFYKLGLIKSLEMVEAKDRRWPYLVGAIFYYVTAILLKTLGLPAEAHLYLSACALTILMHLLLLKFLKPSAHMAGIGGFTALLIAISLRYESALLPLISLCFLMAGFLGTARLRLLAHDYKELAIGFFSGFTLVLLSLLWI